MKPDHPIVWQASPSLRMKKGSAVYHAIKRAILLREVLPGEALLEQHIAGDMGCSQGTVREALLRLQEDGLVARRGYQGTVVSDTSPAEAAQMAQIRIRIETVGIRRAAEVLDSAELESLGRLVEQMEAASNSDDQYPCSELDRQFHLRIFRASGLTALEPILMRCALHMHRYTFGNAPPTRRPHASPVAEQHEAILTALGKRDAEAASQIVQTHIEAVIALWSPTLREAMDQSPGWAWADAEFQEAGAGS